MGTRGTHHPARVGGGVGGCLLLLLLGCGQCNYDKKPSRGGVSASRMIRVRHVAARPAPRLPARDNPGRAADTGRAKGMRRCRAVVIPQQKQRRQQHGGGGGRHHAQPSRPVAQPNHNTHLDESNDAACRGGALLGARRRGRRGDDDEDGDLEWGGGAAAAAARTRVMATAAGRGARMRMSTIIMMRGACTQGGRYGAPKFAMRPGRPEGPLCTATQRPTRRGGWGARQRGARQPGTASRGGSDAAPRQASRAHRTHARQLCPPPAPPIFEAWGNSRSCVGHR